MAQLNPQLYVIRLNPDHATHKTILVAAHDAITALQIARPRNHTSAGQYYVERVMHLPPGSEPQLVKYHCVMQGDVAHLPHTKEWECNCA